MPAKRPILPPRSRKCRHGAIRGLPDGPPGVRMLPDCAAKSPSLPKPRALPINETYFAEGWRSSRRGTDYRFTGHTCGTRGIGRPPDRSVRGGRRPLGRAFSAPASGEIAPGASDYRYSGHTCVPAPVVIPINGTPGHRPSATPVHHDTPDTPGDDRPVLPDAPSRTPGAFTNDTPDIPAKTMHLMTTR